MESDSGRNDTMSIANEHWRPVSTGWTQFSIDLAEDGQDAGSTRTTSTWSNASTTSWAGDVDGVDMMAEHLFLVSNNLDWCRKASACVTVRSLHAVVTKPSDALQKAFCTQLAEKMDLQVVLIMANDLTATILSRIPPMCSSVAVADGRVIRVFQDLADFSNLKHSTRSGYCLIRQLEGVLLWTSDAKLLTRHGKSCEKDLSGLQWISKSLEKNSWTLAHDKADVTKSYSDSIRIVVEEVVGDESSFVEAEIQQQRDLRLVWPMTVAVAFILMGLIAGKLLSQLLIALLRDRSYQQALFILYLPFSIWLSSFFLSIMVVGVFQAFGPIAQMQANSATYSGVRPAFSLRTADLPHITIQCPIYKEGLWDVIDPTMESIRQAIETYEIQGGTASVIINDDGMRLLSSEEQDARKVYYNVHNIGWIARPPHGVLDFERVGAFKKASNLNFGLRTSIEIEARYTQLARDLGESDYTYARALETVVRESNGLLWAAGDVGLGDIILLIDADTRVPLDCFLDAVKEFYSTPLLAILQHPCGILQVLHNFWENSLAHFTKNNYFGTRYVVSGGDSTPFFGHNAFLRFSALDDISEMGIDGKRCWWSETHVSEDFELSLKLLSAGYSTRMAGYSNGEFQEGVCLSVYDELNRWEKYAFGVSELIFHPFSDWFRKGPITPLFRSFLQSDMSLSTKCSSLFYMSTYYGIGLSWLLCLINYILIGFFPLLIRPYYVDSLQILIAVSVIFSLKDAIIGPLVRYRLKEVTLLQGFLESIKYFIIMSLFLQGISMHVSKCLVWHLCDGKMSWESTSKSVLEHATLKHDLPMIWQRFRVVYYTCMGLTVMLLLFGCVVPEAWRITDPRAILPLAWSTFWHACIPLFLHNRSFLSEIYR